MSVYGSLEALLREGPNFIPRRLRALVHSPDTPDHLKVLLGHAGGPNRLRIWRLGEGDFVEGPISESLHLRIDVPPHALIEAAHQMTVQTYLNALADTRTLWENSEGDIEGNQNA